jgi:hypothetical protein
MGHRSTPAAAGKGVLTDIPLHAIALLPNIGIAGIVKILYEKP